MTALSEILLEAARRREIYVGSEARLTGESETRVRTTIRKLRRDKKIYLSSLSRSAFWGSSGAGYRAVREEVK